MEAAIERLREAIKGKSRDAVVIFDGQELLVGYGVYLLSYLESQLKLGEQRTKSAQEKRKLYRVWEHRSAGGKSPLHSRRVQEQIRDLTRTIPEPEGDA